MFTHPSSLLGCEFWLVVAWKDYHRLSFPLHLCEQELLVFILFVLITVYYK